jgi:hypothetical protein
MLCKAGGLCVLNSPFLQAFSSMMIVRFVWTLVPVCGLRTDGDGWILAPFNGESTKLVEIINGERYELSERNARASYYSITFSARKVIGWKITRMFRDAFSRSNKKYDFEIKFMSSCGGVSTAETPLADQFAIMNQLDGVAQKVYLISKELFVHGKFVWENDRRISERNLACVEGVVQGMLMEAVRGPSLRQHWLETFPIGEMNERLVLMVRQSVHVGLRMIEHLRRMHEAGIVYRNLHIDGVSFVRPVTAPLPGIVFTSFELVERNDVVDWEGKSYELIDAMMLVASLLTRNNFHESISSHVNFFTDKILPLHGKEHAARICELFEGRGTQDQAKVCDTMTVLGLALNTVRDTKSQPDYDALVEHFDEALRIIERSA